MASDMLSQRLQQRLQQKLSPQQIQVIKLLEVPTVELEERIQEEIEDNPALEEGESEEINDTDDDFPQEENPDGGNNDDSDLDEYMDDDDIPDYKLNVSNSSRDDKHEDIPFSIGTTFHEYLMEQLHLQELSEQDMTIAEYIIGNIDEEGYLRRELDAMVDDIAFQLGLDVQPRQVLAMLAVVQDLEPAGVGARTLQECLSLQLQRKTQTPSVALAAKIIDTLFELFTKRHYDKIMQRLNLSEQEVKVAISEIVKLNPKPGNAWGTILEKNMQQVVPDFVVEEVEGEPVVSLNNKDVPELRVSKTYQEMFKDYTKNKSANASMKDAVVFVKQKLDSAKWFIDALKQRNNTMLLTMSAIIRFQREFFLKGDETLIKPMILKDIAEITDFDISTISRVSNGKYIQTDFGLYPVKFFFSESMQNAEGEEVSSREIKSILQKCVNEEDKRQPVTDEQLAAVLGQHGYRIARRTVAKYREQLNIPVARLRREI